MNHQNLEATDCRVGRKMPFISLGHTRILYVTEDSLDDLRSVQEGLRKQLALVNAAVADIERQMAAKAAATASMTPIQPFNDMELSA